VAVIVEPPIVVIKSVSVGYYAMLSSAAQSDLSHLHRHLLDIKSLVSTMSMTVGGPSAVGAGSAVSSRQAGGSVLTDDRLLVAVRQSDSSTL